MLFICDFWRATGASTFSRMRNRTGGETSSGIATSPKFFSSQPGSGTRSYKEFEVSPNGFWIDLDITSGEKRDLKSGLKRRVRIDEKSRTWTAELALPMKSLTARFDPAKVWRVNFFRVEGASGAALLFGVAADGNAGAEFSRS